MQYFIIVFSYVFWRQLHLASTNVISILDEGGVEHNSANCFVFYRPCIFELDFHIASQCERLSLLVCKHKGARLLLNLVVLLFRVLKKLNDLHARTFVDLKVRVTTTIRHVWDMFELDCAQAFNSWRMHLLLVKSLKIVEVPQLARLRNSLSCCEPHMVVEL